MANAYGGVLLTRQGQVLLREPANHFDDYVWTFAKGKPKAGDTPERTALREVLKETGYQAEIVDVLPGIFHSGLSSNAYFVMRPIGPQAKTDWETKRTRWVDIETAANLIQQTTNLKGRERDLAVLSVARNWFQSNLTVVPDQEHDKASPVKKSDWKSRDMPARFVTLSLNFTLNALEAANIQKGFIPTEMEEKWFAYFANNILYQHRSWTGFCIDQVHFVPQADGLRARHAEVNREPGQYQCTDDAEDGRRIEKMVRELAVGVVNAKQPSGLLKAIGFASQPGYLGNPEVVSNLLEKYVLLVMKTCSGDASFQDKHDMNLHITRVMCEEVLGYTRMPGWHIKSGLGKNIVQYLELDADYCKDEDLWFIVREGVAAVGLALGQLDVQWKAAVEAEENFDISFRLAALSDFVVAVFVGTNMVSFPGQVLKDMVTLSALEMLEKVSDEQTQADIELDVPVIPFTPAGLSSSDQLLASLNKRQSPFTFFELGISLGTVLTFKLDSAVTCRVTEKNRVVYRGEMMSLSKAAVHALQTIGRKVTTARGPDYWTISEQTLTSIRFKGSVLAN